MSELLIVQSPTFLFILSDFLLQFIRIFNTILIRFFHQTINDRLRMNQ